MSDYPTEEDYAEGTRFTFWYAQMILLFVIIVGGGLMVFTPIQTMWMRETHQQSLQYVEAKQGMLVKLVTECETLKADIAIARADGYPEVADALDSQRRSIVARIRQETELLPMIEIPRSDGSKWQNTIIQIDKYLEHCSCETAEAHCELAVGVRDVPTGRNLIT